MAKMGAEFEAAVGGIVKAAVAGDFSQRVDLDGKTGMVFNVGSAINSLCANVAMALDDLITMLNALAEGDLTQRITSEYHGNFAVLKDNANKTAERIGTTIAEIKAAAAEVDRCIGRNFRQHHRPLAAYRGTGGEPGADLGLDGGDFGDREEERRKRAARQPVGRRYPRRRRTRRRRWWRKR